MNNKFNFVKFILDCFICFGIVIISPFVYSVLIKSDELRWLLAPMQWFLPLVQWVLFPLQWFFNIDIYTINNISEFIVGFCSLSIIIIFIINIFYKIHRVSLSLSLVFMICYVAFAYYFFSHL